MMEIVKLSAPAPVDTPLDDINLDDWLVDDIDLHAECCSRPEFLCGADFHPEAVATEPSEDACEDCLVEIIQGRCPPLRPRHFHCPLVERTSGLLVFCKGPKYGNTR